MAKEASFFNLIMTWSFGRYSFSTRIVEAFSLKEEKPFSLVILRDFCSIPRLSLTEEPSNSCYDIDLQI
jgi:hypothetical protein